MQGVLAEAVQTSRTFFSVVRLTILITKQNEDLLLDQFSTFRNRGALIPGVVVEKKFGMNSSKSPTCLPIKMLGPLPRLLRNISHVFLTFLIYTSHVIQKYHQSNNLQTHCFREASLEVPALPTRSRLLG